MTDRKRRVVRPAIAAGLAIGAGAGTALFAGADNPVWIGVGAGIGMAIGAAIDSRRRAAREDPEPPSQASG